MADHDDAQARLSTAQRLQAEMYREVDGMLEAAEEAQARGDDARAHALLDAYSAFFQSFPRPQCPPVRTGILP